MPKRKSPELTGLVMQYRATRLKVAKVLEDGNNKTTI